MQSMGGILINLLINEKSTFKNSPAFKNLLVFYANFQRKCAGNRSDPHVKSRPIDGFNSVKLSLNILKRRIFYVKLDFADCY